MNHFTNKIILEKLEQRRLTNKYYSLRAFARDLKVSPSLISRVINGHIPLSLNTLEQIGSILNLTEKEQSLIKSEIAAFDREKRISMLTSEEQVVFDELTGLKSFGWLPFALLEMINFIDFKILKEKLQVSSEDLQKVMDKMLEKNILVLKNNEYKVATSAQRLLSKKAALSFLDEKNKFIIKKLAADFDKKDLISAQFISSTICINSESLPEVQKIIAKAHKRILKHIKTNEGNKDSAYELNINFTPWWN